MSITTSKAARKYLPHFNSTTKPPEPPSEPAYLLVAFLIDDDALQARVGAARQLLLLGGLARLLLAFAFAFDEFGRLGAGAAPETLRADMDRAESS